MAGQKATQGVEKSGEETPEARRKRLMRKGWVSIAAGVFLGGMSVYAASLVLDGWSRDRRLDASGVVGVARIERKYIGPDGGGTRISYRVEKLTPDGRLPESVGVDIEPEAWDTLEVGGTMPVEFIEGDPDVSRPLVPHQFGGRHTRKINVIAFAGPFMAMVLVVMGVSHLRGWDFKTPNARG